MLATTKRRLVWTVLGVVAFLAAIAASAIGGAWWMRGKVATANREIGRIVSPHGIQEAKYVRIGGVRQWITISGQDRRAPILVYLHGGPGEAASDASYAVQRPWEDYFTVVQWDQRGAGRSGVDPASHTTLNRERIVADTIEVVNYVRAKLGQRKVIIVGQSWGTVLAMEVAHRRPDLLHAVFSIGQQTSWKPAYFDERRQLLMTEAKKTGDKARYDELAASGGPRPFKNGWELDEWTQVTQTELIRSGHMWYNARGRTYWTIDFCLFFVTSPTFSISTYRTISNTSVHWADYFGQMYASFKDWELEKDVSTRFSVPVIFFMGKHDWTTPITAARRYFDKVCAPWKAWVEFPNSAHIVLLEEPGRTIVELTRLALPAARGEQPAGTSACPQAPSAPPARMDK